MDALRRVLLFLTLIFFQPASAVVIEYELTDLGSDRYRYDYTVINDGSLGAGVSVQLFGILFNPSLYDEPSLSIVSGSSVISDWDEQILNSFPPFAAAYDLSAISSGVLEGDAASGFAVEFNWLGLGAPGTQDFEIYDPVSWDLLEIGTTQLVAATGVPEPSTLLLIVCSIGLMLVKARALTGVSHS